MNVFDLLFVLLFLTGVVTLIVAGFVAIRGRGARARRILRALAIGAGVYMAVVVLSSAVWPRRVLQVGEPRCVQDKWCIVVKDVSRAPAQGRGNYDITFWLVNREQRYALQENRVVVYLIDNRGHRYEPVPPNSAATLSSVPVQPLEAVPIGLTFEVPAEMQEVALIIEIGSPIRWFIIGREAWFHKPTIVRLP